MRFPTSKLQVFHINSTLCEALMESGQGCMALKLGMTRFCWATFTLDAMIKTPKPNRSVTSLHLKKKCWIGIWDLKFPWLGYALVAQEVWSNLFSVADLALTTSYGPWHVHAPAAISQACFQSTQLSKTEGSCRGVHFAKQVFDFFLRQGRSFLS